MKRRHDGGDPPVAAPAEPPAPEQAAPERAEPSGLEPVEGEPLAPPGREEVEALRRERDELLDQLLRKRAEFDNFRKRVERERQAAGLDAAAALLTDLLPTLDNLERALDAPPDAAGLREGVEMIQRGLLSLLESRGVVVEDPTGAVFDPERHQALSYEPAPGHAEGTVVDVYQKGYSFKDRLLRPALVKVAKQAAGGPERGGGSGVHSEPEKVH